jgi:hypothetical protein
MIHKQRDELMPSHLSSSVMPAHGLLIGDDVGVSVGSSQRCEQQPVRIVL